MAKKQKTSERVIREHDAVVPGMMRSSKKQREQEEQWRAESDLRTLTEAEEICEDPKRHGAARKMAHEKMESMRRVTRKK